MPMPTDPEAKAFVPDLPAVLFSTRLVKEGETERLGFTAPTEPGEYIFVCTFPGHWVRMYGVMLVVDEARRLGSESNRAHRPDDQAALHRAKHNDPHALFEGTVSLHTILFAVVPTFVIAWLAAFVAGRLARRALLAVVGDHLSPSSPLVRGPLRLVSFADVPAVRGAAALPGVRAGRPAPARGRAAQDARGVGVRLTASRSLLIGLFAYALDPHDEPPGAALRARGQPGHDPRRARARQARAHARLGRQQRHDHRRSVGVAVLMVLDAVRAWTSRRC